MWFLPPGIYIYIYIYACVCLVLVNDFNILKSKYPYRQVYWLECNCYYNFDFSDFVCSCYSIPTPNLITESVIVLCCVHGEMYLKNTKMQRHFIHGNITTPSQILWWKQHLVTDSVINHRICDGIVLFPCMKFNKILLLAYHYNITESVKVFTKKF